MESIWQQVEYGDYAADLPVWKELAASTGGTIVELGCGVGRVTLHLAAAGRPVLGIDRDPELVGFLRSKVGRHSLTVGLGDARSVTVKGDVGLVLAPMQLMQLLAGPEERSACLTRVAEMLAPGGLAALAIDPAIHEPVAAAGRAPSPVPEVHAVGDWFCASLPLEAQPGPDSVVLRRLRQAVTTGGAVHEELNVQRLCLLDADTLEREAAEVDLQPVGRHSIPATDTAVASVAVVLERV